MGKVSDSQKKARDKWDGENMAIIGYKENKQKNSKLTPRVREQQQIHS